MVVLGFQLSMFTFVLVFGPFFTHHHLIILFTTRLPFPTLRAEGREFYALTFLASSPACLLRSSNFFIVGAPLRKTGTHIDCTKMKAKDDLPSEDHTALFLVYLSGAALVWGIYVKSIKSKLLRKHIADLGVSLSRVKRAASEIERKVFHLCGLLVPLIYQLLLQKGFSKNFCAGICWTVTIGQVAFHYLCYLGCSILKDCSKFSGSSI